MGFGVPSKRITVVYSNDYVSAANIIEARIQAFAGYTSRLWDVSFYEANKATLDSDQLVLFLGGFDENPAAGTYAKVFSNKEKVCGCFYSIAGSKALIFPTGEVSENPVNPDGAANFYSDSAGNTRSGNGHASISNIDLSVLLKPATGMIGGLIDRVFTPKSVSRQEQLECGCEEFMQKRFAGWVGYSAT